MLIWIFIGLMVILFIPILPRITVTMRASILLTMILIMTLSYALHKEFKSIPAWHLRSDHWREGLLHPVGSKHTFSMQNNWHENLSKNIASLADTAFRPVFSALLIALTISLLCALFKAIFGLIECRSILVHFPLNEKKQGRLIDLPLSGAFRDNSSVEIDDSFYADPTDPLKQMRIGKEWLSAGTSDFKDVMFRDINELPTANNGANNLFIAANKLATIIDDNITEQEYTPLISVTGNWGSGKTTCINWALNQLNEGLNNETRPQYLEYAPLESRQWQELKLNTVVLRASAFNYDVNHIEEYIKDTLDNIFKYFCMFTSFPAGNRNNASQLASNLTNGDLATLDKIQSLLLFQSPGIRDLSESMIRDLNDAYMNGGSFSGWAYRFRVKEFKKPDNSGIRPIIFIVFDDLDRIQKESLLQTLSLIDTLRKIRFVRVIMLSDPKHLNEQLSSIEIKDPSAYMQKLRPRAVIPIKCEYNDAEQWALEQFNLYFSQEDRPSCVDWAICLIELLDRKFQEYFIATPPMKRKYDLHPNISIPGDSDEDNARNFRVEAYKEFRVKLFTAFKRPPESEAGTVSGPTKSFAEDLGFNSMDLTNNVIRFTSRQHRLAIFTNSRLPAVVFNLVHPSENMYIFRDSGDQGYYTKVISQFIFDYSEVNWDDFDFNWREVESVVSKYIERTYSAHRYSRETDTVDLPYGDISFDGEIDPYIQDEDNLDERRFKKFSKSFYRTEYSEAQRIYWQTDDSDSSASTENLPEE